MNNMIIEHNSYTNSISGTSLLCPNGYKHSDFTTNVVNIPLENRSSENMENVEIINLKNEINEEHVGNSFKDLYEEIQRLNDENKKLNIEIKILNNDGVLQYLAGFFDGEGSIHIEKNEKNITYHLRIKFPNNNLEVIKRIQWYFSNHSLIKNIGLNTKQYERTKAVYKVVYNGKDALYILKILEPYLIIKKERSNIAIEFQERIEKLGRLVNMSDNERQIRESYYLKMKELNIRGVNDISEEDSIDLEEELNEINNLCKDPRQSKLEF